MRVAFIDESERSDEHYFLGALVCTGEQLGKIEGGLASLMAETSIAVPDRVNVTTELHGYELMQGRGDWKGVPLRLRANVFVRALEIVSDSGACMHVEGVDVQALAARNYKYPKPPRDVALSYLLERIHECCRRARDEVHVYADAHHTADEARLQLSDYQAGGTFGYKSSLLTAIQPPMRFIDSKQSRALQAADLYTYLYNRRRTKDETDPRAQELKDLMVAAASRAMNRGGHRIWP